MQNARSSCRPLKFGTSGNIYIYIFLQFFFNRLMFSFDVNIAVLFILT